MGPTLTLVGRVILPEVAVVFVRTKLAEPGTPDTDAKTV